MNSEELKLFLESDLFKGMVSQFEEKRQKEIDAKRAQAIIEVKELRASRESLFQPHRDAIKKANADYEAAQKAAREAGKARAAADNAMTAVSWQYTQQLNSLEGFLRSTAPPELTDRLKELQAERERLSHINCAENYPDNSPRPGPTRLEQRNQAIAKIDAEILNIRGRIIGAN